MGYTHGTNIDDELRTCTKCKITYPNTNEFFGWANKSKGRLQSVCKCCIKKINKEKNEQIKQSNMGKSLFYEGTKSCKKCGRELPNNKLYFSIDLSCKTGLRNVCRECSPKEAGFLKENYKVSEKWTDEENDLLIKMYSDYTGLELHENFFPNRSIRAIECHAGELGIQGKSYDTFRRARDRQIGIVSEKLRGRSLSEETKHKLSESRKEYYKTHEHWAKEKGFSEAHKKHISESKIKVGKWKGEDNPRHKNPLNGELNGRWKGSILNTYVELRSETKDWSNKSMEFCNYKCVITGKDFDNVHHTTAFKDIVDEVFKLTKIEVKPKVCDYSTEEFDELRYVLKELHIEYGFGACISKEFHKLFHDNYGYTKFTPYDFLDFVYRLDCGEFDNWLLENNIDLNINYEYMEYLESTLLSLESA